MSFESIPFFKSVSQQFSASPKAPTADKNNNKPQLDQYIGEIAESVFNSAVSENGSSPSLQKKTKPLVKIHKPNAPVESLRNSKSHSPSPFMVCVNNFIDFLNELTGYSKLVSEDLKKQLTIAEEFSQLRDWFNTKTNEIQAYRYKKKTFDELFSIFYHNYNFLLPFLEFFLSEERFEIIKLYSSENKELVKDFKNVFSINYLELYYRNLYRRKLIAFREKHHLNNSEEVDEIFKKCEITKRKNSTTISQLNKKCSWKIAKLTTCKIVPFLFFTVTSFFSDYLIQNLEKKTLTKAFKLFFKFCKNYSGFNKLYVANQSRQRWINSHQIPLNTSYVFSAAFKNFLSNQHQPTDQTLLSLKARKILVKKFEDQTGESAYKGKTLVQEKIRQEEKDFLSQCDQKKLSLNRLIMDYQDENFESFHNTLKEKGFFLKSIEGINSWELWNQSFEKPEFCDNFIKETVHYQITIGKLLKNSLELMISKKVETEKSFLIFNLLKNIADSVFNLIEFISIFPKAALSLAHLSYKQLIESTGSFFNNSLLSFASVFLYVLDPRIDISPLGFVNIAFTHLFGYYYKPKEFGLNGSIYSVKLRSYRILIILNLTLKLLTKSCKALDFLLLKRVNISLSQSWLCNKLKNSRKANRKTCIDKISFFENKIEKLKQLDFNQSFNPFYNEIIDEYNEDSNKVDFVKYSTLKKYLQENHCPKEIIQELNKQISDNDIDNQLNNKIDSFLQLNLLFKRTAILNSKVNLKYNSNPINTVMDFLKESDRSVFLSDTTHFFRQYIDSPSKSNNNSTHQIEKLFTTSGTSFFKLLDRPSVSQRSKQ